MLYKYLAGHHPQPDRDAFGTCLSTLPGVPANKEGRSFFPLLSTGEEGKSQRLKNLRLRGGVQMMTLEKYPDIRLELIDRSRQELLIINWVDYNSIFNAGVSYLTGGDAGHTSIIVPEILPNGKPANALLHVHALGSGVKYNRVSHTIARKDYAIVYRVQAGGNLSETYDLLISLVDKKYDWAQIAFIAAAVAVQRLVGTERFWQVFTGSWLDDWYEKETKGTYICSEVASIALRDYGAGSSWPSDRPVGFINPNNLVDIFKLQEIMRFKA